MVGVARHYLKPHAAHEQFIVADASALPILERADSVFSTATFHWILDHPRLFRSLQRRVAARRPAGRAVGRRRESASHTRAVAATDGRAVLRSVFHPVARALGVGRRAEVTAKRLVDAGFEEVLTSVEPSLVVHPDAEAFRIFITNIICRPNQGLPAGARAAGYFINGLTEQAAGGEPPFSLD
jgi:trans-aconitate 2-methyltransferase